MANNEQDYAPQAKPADEVTKPCQEGIRVRKDQIFAELAALVKQ